MGRRQNKNSVGGDVPPFHSGTTFDLTAAEFDSLLGTLCVDLGCCLSPQASRALWETRPGTVDEFVEALCRAEGLDNDTRDSVRASVTSHTQQFIATCRVTPSSF